MTTNSEKKQSFEQGIERLQEIIASLEKGDVALEESVALYKEGMQLSKACRTQLEKARHEITLFADNADQAFSETSYANEGNNG